MSKLIVVARIMQHSQRSQRVHLHDWHDIPIFVFRKNSLMETNNVQSMENNIILEKIDKSFHSLVT
jgi:hypothetical protein